ncbi:hypothetical protein V2J09_006231 [Rumex salicifolius]
MTPTTTWRSNQIVIKVGAIVAVCRFMTHSTTDLALRTRAFRLVRLRLRGRLRRIANVALQSVYCKVTVEMNLALVVKPTHEEVRVALFQMHPTKAPGIDGMHAVFYQKFWGLWVLWENSASLGEINTTAVTLIPKISSPKHIRDYRPISLCTVIYKIVSNLLANQLKVCLPSIISESQQNNK